MKLPTNTEAMRKFAGMLLEAGLTEKELDLISRKVPKILLGIS